MDIIAETICDAHTLACPLAACDFTIDVPDIPISDQLGAVFGMSGETLARVHADQQINRACGDMERHLASHTWQDWYAELRTCQTALREQIAMWTQIQQADGPLW